MPQLSLSERDMLFIAGDGGGGAGETEGEKHSVLSERNAGGASDVCHLRPLSLLRARLADQNLPTEAQIKMRWC